MNSDGKTAKRIRQLFWCSTVLFGAFCVLPGLGSRSELRAPGEFSVTNLLAQLAGIFAWTLMCSAYQMRGKLNAEGAPPAK